MTWRAVSVCPYVLESNPIRVCVGVIDASGNQGSTCEKLPSPYIDIDPPTFLAAPTVVGVTPTSIDVLVEMSEPGTVHWLPLYECQVGGVWRTSIRPTLNRRSEARPCVYCMSIHPAGRSRSDLGLCACCE
jgi:hypothetical protein